MGVVPGLPHRELLAAGGDGDALHHVALGHLFQFPAGRGVEGLALRRGGAEDKGGFFPPPPPALLCAPSFPAIMEL